MASYGLPAELLRTARTTPWWCTILSRTAGRRPLQLIQRRVSPPLLLPWAASYSSLAVTITAPARALRQRNLTHRIADASVHKEPRVLLAQRDRRAPRVIPERPVQQGQPARQAQPGRQGGRDVF